MPIYIIVFGVLLHLTLFICMSGQQIIHETKPHFPVNNFTLSEQLRWKGNTVIVLTQLTSWAFGCRKQFWHKSQITKAVIEELLDSSNSKFHPCTGRTNAVLISIFWKRIVFILKGHTHIWSRRYVIGIFCPFWFFAAKKEGSTCLWVLRSKKNISSFMN